MKKLVLITILVASIGCGEKTKDEKKPDNPIATNSAAFSLNDLDEHWSMLTAMNGEDVILEPCDSANIEFTFKKNDRGWEIEQISGQEAFLYDVVSTQEASNDILINVKDRHQEHELTFILKDFSLDKNVLKWEAPNMPLEANFVNSDGISNYKVLKEPEEDCM